jgi:tetratricopeptide (TPR) repeat protein
MGHDSQLRGTETGRLDSWKEIASFLHRDARTVRRWERERHLPVHRVPGGERSGVFAYVSELERWLHADPPVSAAGVDSEAEAAAAVLPAEGEVPIAPPVSVFQSLNSFAVGVPAETGTGTPTVHILPPPGASPEPVPASTRMRGYQLASLAALLLLAIGISAAALHLRAARHATVAVHQPNAEARELYLRGRYYWNLRTEEGLNCAVDLFMQSIVNDPKYAAAYAGLADAYLLLRQYGHMPNSEAYPRALAAANQAIALDDTSPEAHRSLAFILRFWEWDMAAAEKEYRRAIALNPGDSQSHHWYATALLSAGRNREALDEIDKARSLEPQSVSVLADRGLILAATDPRAGVAALQQAEQAQPSFLCTHKYLSGIYLDLGDYAGFVKEGRLAAAIAHDSAMLAVLDRAQRVLAARGPAAMLREVARGYAPLADQGVVAAYEAARFFSLAGEPDQAIHYLHLSCDRRDPGFLTVEGDAALAPLHASPEYAGMVSRRDRSRFGPGRPVAELQIPGPF